MRKFEPGDVVVFRNITTEPPSYRLVLGYDHNNINILVIKNGHSGGNPQYNYELVTSSMRAILPTDEDTV